jgi:uncharacterized repeat protein (TIGR01451 family)
VTLKKLGQAVCLALLMPALAMAAKPVRSSALPADVLRVLTEQAKLTAVGDPIGDEFEAFGSTVAADGDTLVAGAPGHNLPWARAGAAYVFVRTAGTWTLEAKLSPTGPTAVEGFGVAVTVSGDTVVVGASDDSATEAYVFVRTSGVWMEEARVAGSDTETGDDFGKALSIDGDTLVVGAPRDTTGFGFDSGSAYVFVRTAGVWTEQQKLLPADVAERDEFGYSVSVSGDTIVAGSPGDDTGTGIDAGSAYLFTRTGTVWTPQAKLLASGGVSGDQFGRAVSLDGDTVAVGAPLAESSVFRAGAAQVFVRTGTDWSWEQTLTATVPETWALFGTSVALQADRLMVGAPGEDTQAGEAAAAYAFVRGAGTWGVEQRLTASVDEPFPSFGHSVALSGDAGFVGAPGRDDGSGSAYVFRRVGAWAEEARLDPPGTASFDDFGASVAIEGDVLVIGAPGDDLPQGRAAGAAYVFIRRGAAWTLQQKLVGSDASENDGFGATVALSGDTLAVGAPEMSYPEGAVYLFVRAGGAWQEQQKLVPQVRNEFSFFGSALSLHGDSLIVGAPREAEAGADEAGSAYVFARSGSLWSLTQRLVSPNPSDYAVAGTGVAIEGDTAFVGVPRGPTGGKTVAFQRQAEVWTPVQEISASDATPGDWFGASLSLSGDTVLAGAPQTESSGYGAAYVFVRAGGPWYEQQKLLPAGPAAAWPEFGKTVAVSGGAALVAPRSDAFGTSGGSVLFFERANATWTQRQRITAFDGTQYNRFGAAIAVSGATFAVGAPRATTPAGLQSGAVYVLMPATTDLGVGISGSPGGVVQGDPVTYTIVVSNSGPDAAPDVGLVSTLDRGLILQSVSASQGSCSTAVSGATCDLGVIPAGGSANVSVEAVAAGAGVQMSQATISWGGSDLFPGNNTGSVSTTVAPGGPSDLSVALTSLTQTAAVGFSLTHRIDVENLGPATAAGVTVQDPTPPGLTLAYTAGACWNGFPCLIARIPAGETRTLYATFDIPVSYPGPDPVVNTVSITSATADPDASNDTSTASTPFFVPAGNLGYHTVTPCRLLDTRDPGLGGGAPLEAGEIRWLFPFYHLCGVAWGAKAIVVNVTVTEPSTTGNLRLYPSGLPVPNVSMLTYGAGQTRGSNGVVSLGRDGALSIRVGQPSGTVHVIVDVFGYFE